jgi:hypothetical protein
VTVIHADDETIGTIRQRWNSQHHVGDKKPVMRAYVRTGILRRNFRATNADNIFAVIPGVQGRRIWQGLWDARDSWSELPNVKLAEIEQNFDENGVAQATITIDNIAMVEQGSGVANIYHLIERGYYAPFRGYKPPRRPKVGTKNEWFDKLASKSTQIILLAGYGDAVIPIFLGLINDVDMTSRPDSIVLTCRDHGQFLTDQRCFINAKVRHVPDPITFADRRHADNTELLGHGARSSAHANGHPSRFVLDDKNKTWWESPSNNHSDDIEWIEIAVPAGRYENIRVDPKFDGQEAYIAIHAQDNGAPGGKGARRRFDERLPEGWVDEGRGHIPGTGVPYVKHIKRLKNKDTIHSFPDWGYILGNNSKIRLYVTNLDYAHHGTKHKNYRAGISELQAYRRRTSKEAKREKWILVDDLSDIIKTIFQWCGINDWEVESTGVRLKDKAVFNRSDFLIDIVNKAAEQVGYVFYMKPPDVFDEGNLDADHNLSTGIGVFRQQQSMKQHPLDRIELVHEDRVLRGIDAKLSDEPLSSVIRVRGKEISKKRGGRRLGGDHSRRWMYVYRPPWARDSKTKAIHGQDSQIADDELLRNAGLKKYRVWHDNRLRSLNQCKIAALFIAFREALESAQVRVEAPCMPSIFLDHQAALFDTGTGLSTRFWVVDRSLSFQSGEEGHFTMTLAGSLIDFPDIAAVRQELTRALRDHNYDPGLRIGERTGRVGRIYRNN